MCIVYYICMNMHFFLYKLHIDDIMQTPENQKTSLHTLVFLNTFIRLGKELEDICVFFFVVVVLQTYIFL